MNAVPPPWSAMIYPENTPQAQWRNNDCQACGSKIQPGESTEIQRRIKGQWPASIRHAQPCTSI